MLYVQYIILQEKHLRINKCGVILATFLFVLSADKQSIPSASKESSSSVDSSESDREELRPPTIHRMQSTNGTLFVLASGGK